MQLYVADYLGDTRHLTTEQHGAYLLLLMTMWRSEGRLPNDSKKLARITGCTASRWARIADDVLAFFDVDGDDLTNKRLMLELEKATEKSFQRAVSGTKGGKAKALKSKKPAVANASDLLCHSSEPEPEREEAIASLSTRPTRVEVARGWTEFWSLYPRKVAKDAAAKAFPKALARIDGPDPVTVLLDGLRRALPGWDDPEFIPHPATWLNRGQWSDDAPTPRTEKAHVRPANDHRTAKADHLGSVARAMAAACGGSEPEHRGDRPRPGDAGGSPAMLPAA